MIFEYYTNKSMTAELNQKKAEMRAATEKLAHSFNPSPPDINSIFVALTNHLNSNPSIFSAAFAFSSEIKNSAPFVFRGENGLEQKDIASKIDYTKLIWYEVPLNLGQAIWSVPYFDFGGVSEDILLTTYSIPLFNQQDSSFFGVLTSNYLLARIEKLPSIPELSPAFSLLAFGV